jgi:hypothetical protein
VFVGRPQLHRRVRECLGNSAQEWAEVFLNCACCLGSASAWRGRAA